MNELHKLIVHTDQSFALIRASGRTRRSKTDIELLETCVERDQDFVSGHEDENKEGRTRSCGVDGSA